MLSSSQAATGDGGGDDGGGDDRRLDDNAGDNSGDSFSDGNNPGDNPEGKPGDGGGVSSSSGGGDGGSDALDGEGWAAARPLPGRAFGRRASHSRHGRTRVGQDDEDSTDTDETTSGQAGGTGRDARDRGAYRRSRSKKQSGTPAGGGGSAGSSDGLVSSSSGGHYRSVSVNSQFTPSSSDSDGNSPRSCFMSLATEGLEADMCSDSGSGGSSGSERLGSPWSFQDLLRPTNFVASSTVRTAAPSGHPKPLQPVRAKAPPAQASRSALQRVFHDLVLTARPDCAQQGGYQRRPRQHHRSYQDHCPQHADKQAFQGSASNLGGDDHDGYDGVGKRARRGAQQRSQSAHSAQYMTAGRILRAPVPCAYLPGPSGLPTKRVPRQRLLQHALHAPHALGGVRDSAYSNW